MANAAFLRLHKHHVLRPFSSFCITVSDKTPPLKVIYKEEKKIGFWASMIISVQLSAFIFSLFVLGLITRSLMHTYEFIPMNKLWVNLFDREFNKVIFSTLVKWRPV